jgi:cyclopropane fatty-acyl-phospholipid synthase-like methyltransferase
MTTLRLLTASVLMAACAGAADMKPKRTPDVHWEPSEPEIVNAMIKLAQVNKRDIVYDLGCGDGRIVIEAARQTGARGVGIDIDPQRIRESNENAAKARVKKRVTFKTEDIFEANISKASVVMLYLWPHVNLKLRPKLLAELKPGTRIVSHSHTMGDWKPDKEVEVQGHRIYFWVVPPVKK